MVKRPTENHGHNEEEKPEVIDKNRRRVLGTLGKAALVGVLAAGISLPKNANASVVQSETQKVLGLPTEKEKLSESEVGLMDTAMHSIFRHFLQPSFFFFALPAGAEDDVKQIMKTAITNYDKLSYEKADNGYIIISKRNGKNPSSDIPDDFKIEIKDGVITKIGRYKVNLKALGKWKDEWREIQQKIVIINDKISDPNGETLNKMEKKWFEYYSMVLPRQIKELMEMKSAGFGLSKDEKDSLDALTKALAEHPVFYGEKGKPAKLKVKIKPKNGKFATPDFAAEIAYTKLHPEHPTETFCTFSFEGNILTNTNKGQPNTSPNWVQSSPSFADIYRKKQEKK